MCLKNISHRPIQYGFKVGRILNDGFSAFITDSGHWFYDYKNKPAPTKFNEWEFANLNDVAFRTGENTYKSGFHICPSLKIARDYLLHLTKNGNVNYKNWKIFPCEYYGVLGTGEDESGIETVLAVAIKISSESLS